MATVSPISDRIWLWLLVAQSWLCSIDSIALASKRGRVRSRWLGGWDRVSPVLQPIDMFNMVMNFDGLGWCLMTDLKGGG